MNQLTFKEQLERHGNESDVRDRMVRGLYHGEHLGVAQEWLRRKEEARATASSAKRDAREEETLSIARSALSNSKRANAIAVTAIVLSAATAIIAAVIGVMYGSK